MPCGEKSGGKQKTELQFAESSVTKQMCEVTGASKMAWKESLEQEKTKEKTLRDTDILGRGRTNKESGRLIREKHRELMY